MDLCRTFIQVYRDSRKVYSHRVFFIFKFKFPNPKPYIIPIRTLYNPYSPL